MSDDEIQHKGIAQREESNGLLRTIRLIVGTIGSTLLLAAFSILGVAIGDHYGLIAVSEKQVESAGKLDALVLVVTQANKDAAARGDENFQHLVKIDAEFVTAKAEALAAKAEALAMGVRVSELERNRRK